MRKNRFRPFFIKIILCLLLSSFLFSHLELWGTVEVVQATAINFSPNALIKYDGVNFRDQAGVEGKLLFVLNKNTPVVFDKTVKTESKLYPEWNQIQVWWNNTLYKGYVVSSFVDTKPEAAFLNETVQAWKAKQTPEGTKETSPSAGSTETSTSSSTETTSPTATSSSTENSNTASTSNTEATSSLATDSSAVESETSGSEDGNQPITTQSLSEQELRKVNGVIPSMIQNYSMEIPANFQDSLGQFPTSYHEYLKALHERYPNWKFIPLNIDADWSTVVSAQTKLGVSLIENSVIDAWKSKAPGAYDPATNRYIPFDGATWVNAAPGLVEYYLDPRNLMATPYVFQFLNLSFDRNVQTNAGVERILQYSFMSGGGLLNTSGLQTNYTQTFMDAALASGASPYFLAARVLQEVGIRGSNSTTGTYAGAFGSDPSLKGYYNFFNIGAYSSADPVRLGLIYARYGSHNASAPMSPANQAKYLIPWNTPYRAIVGGSKYVSANYINAGQYTLYLQKFDVAFDGGNGFYRHQYMTNIRALTGESTRMHKAYSDLGILDVPLIFSIPVYRNMPATRVIKPGETEDSNNYLKELEVEGYSLNPIFDPHITDGYMIKVPQNVNTISIKASPLMGTSTITGAGNHDLPSNKNSFTISVKAQNGAVRNYNLTIFKSEPFINQWVETNYSVSGDSTLTGLVERTTWQQFKQNIILKDQASARFLDSQGKEITDLETYTMTGGKIQILDKNQQLKGDYTIVLFGDVNSDGMITASDLTTTVNHILKKVILAEIAKLKGADANHDDVVSASDLTVIVNHILKKGQIIQ